jgi:hypothetical protein
VPALGWSDARDAILLLVVATFLRLWALDELPRALEGEMGFSMLAGTSWYGVKNYLVDALTTVSVGCMHLFVQLASFFLLGDSVFALRASAVVMGSCRGVERVLAHAPKRGPPSGLVRSVARNVRRRAALVVAQ